MSSLNLEVGSLVECGVMLVWFGLGCLALRVVFVYVF